MPSQFTQVHSVKKYRLLTEKSDASGNRYVYLKGVASLADGDFVTYDSAGATARPTTGGTGPVAVAQAAVDAATQYGWFMVHGVDAAANVATHSSGAGKALFISGTAGRATSTPATENCIFGAFTTGNSVSNVGGVMLIGTPVAPGDIST